MAVLFPGDEENLLQLSAATINAEWLVGSMLGQSCQGQCASGSCSACSEQRESGDGANMQKSKVRWNKSVFALHYLFSDISKDGAVCISFLHAGIKQAEEGAAEAGEEEATRGKASAEVSPEQRTSGPEPA